MAPTTNHNTKNFETIKLLLDQAIIGTLKQYIPLTKVRNDGREKKWKLRLTIPVKRPISKLFRLALSSPWRVSLFVPPVGFEEASVTGLITPILKIYGK